jgi:azurin
MKISVPLVLPLLALMMGGFLFLSLAGCSFAPETPPKILEISADDTMKYSVTAFEVRPGQKVSITLTNKGATLKTAGGHDLVVLQKNTNVNKFLEAASLEASHDYVSPDSQKDVLASTKLLGPGEIDTITFTAPYVPANYDFVCSFPGHTSQGMKGVMTVR